MSLMWWFWSGNENDYCSDDDDVSWTESEKEWGEWCDDKPGSICTYVFICLATLYITTTTMYHFVVTMMMAMK